MSATIRTICMDCRTVITEGDVVIESPSANGKTRSEPLSHGLCPDCYEARMEELRELHDQRFMCGDCLQDRTSSLAAAFPQDGRPGPLTGRPEPRRGGTIVAQGKPGAALGNATTINHSLSPSRGEGKGEESLSDYLTTPNPTI